MRALLLETKTVRGLQQILDNSEPAIKDALTITYSLSNGYYLLQDTSTIEERLSCILGKDGKQSMVATAV